ncbi:MAG: alanine racemase [Promethearchaeia archaeon]
MKKIAGNTYIKKDQGDLFFDQVRFESFMKDKKTPLMILLENKIRKNIQTFKRVFSSVFDNFKGFYSFKANYLSQVCKIIKTEKIGAEVIGLPEMKLALSLDFDPENIIVGGPYLPEDLIEMAVKQNVREIIIYDLKDIKKVNKIARKYKSIQNLCLRINSQKYESKLGIQLTEKNLAFLNNVLDQSNHIKISTLLSHFTSQMNSPHQYLKNVQTIVEGLKKLSSFNLNVKNINLGGGFPEAVIMPEKQLLKIANAIKKKLEKSKIEYNQIYFEPGRYFVGDAGLYIAKITKVSNNNWIFLNIGNYICPKFARCSLRFYNADKIDKAHKYKISIAGIVPTDQDVLVKDYFFTQENKENERVLVTNVGAYCLTFSNRFPYQLPQIYMVTDDRSNNIFNPMVDGDFSLY